LIGPTAVGKTGMGIKLASHFNSQIISADSRQIYAEMNIGTAKPTAHDLTLIKHHFISTHSIHNPISVFDYAKEVNVKLISLFKEHNILFLVGGSGLFVNAVCDGLDEIPSVDCKIRNLLNDEIENDKFPELVLELKRVDPDYYNMVDLHNPRRVVRALEVFRGTGKPFSTFLSNSKKKQDYEIIKVGINIEREKLYCRINQRVDSMIKEGFLDEAKELLNFRSSIALKTIGYQELFAYLLGNYDFNTAIDLIKRNTRHFAKRQLTWFKKDQEISWFEPNDFKAIENLIEKKTKSKSD